MISRSVPSAPVRLVDGGLLIGFAYPKFFAYSENELLINDLVAPASKHAVRVILFALFTSLIRIAALVNDGTTVDALPLFLHAFVLTDMSFSFGLHSVFVPPFSMERESTVLVA